VYSIDVPLAVAALAAAQEEIASRLKAAGASESLLYRVRLVVEELLTNLILHGRFRGPAVPARLALSFAESGLTLVIEDPAEPFDPRVVPEPGGPPSLDDDRIGGLGLPLVRKMAVIQAYGQAEGGWNRTELFFPELRDGKKSSG
jgi:anti-sigma regulatory factor (Ser/Thr protein kinase)